jgi:hypothetical protein
MANGHTVTKMEVPTSSQQNVGTSDSSAQQETLPERHYIVPIKDAHGHAERINLRVLPLYTVRLNKILESKKFPFRSTNDIVRWAVDRACVQLEQRAGLPTSLYRQTEAMKRVLVQTQMQLDFLALFEETTRTAQELIGGGASEEAARMVSDLKHQIDGIEEGYWKQRYRRELDNRFGHLLRVTPGEGASLGDSDDEE